MKNAQSENGDEVWREIPCEPNYEASNIGNFRRKDGKRISTWVTNHGYGQTQFNSKKKYATHRLIAMSFLPNPENLPEVNHKNGIKTDNRVNNLEWCSRSYNMKHCFSTGLNSIDGERHPGAKLTESDVNEIRRLRSVGWKQKDLASKFNTHQSTISSVCNRYTWTHI